MTHGPFSNFRFSTSSTTCEQHGTGEPQTRDKCPQTRAGRLLKMTDLLKIKGFGFVVHEQLGISPKIRQVFKNPSKFGKRVKKELNLLTQFEGGKSSCSCLQCSSGNSAARSADKTKNRSPVRLLRSFFRRRSRRNIPATDVKCGGSEVWLPFRSVSAASAPPLLARR